MTDDDTKALAPFFAAARAHDLPPSPTLFDRIATDATALQVERSVRAPHPAPRGRSLADMLRSLFEPVGGWSGAAALGMVAAIGLVAGLSGLDIAGSYLWADPLEQDAAPGGVEAFFDLASLDG